MKAFNIIQNSFLDIDALAFCEAAGITDAVQRGAINTLVRNLKGSGAVNNQYNLWAKLTIIYPLIGGTASTNKFTLKNPTGSFANYQLAFSGGWAHSANGILPNGTNAYTGISITSLFSSINDLHLAYYSRTAAAGSATAVTMMAQTSSTREIGLGIRRSSNLSFAISGNDAQAATFTNTDGRGLYITNRSSSTLLTLYKNGSSVATLTAANTGTLPNSSIGIAAALNSGNSAIAGTYDNKECAFISAGSSFTAAEAAAFYNVIQIYQTILNRQV